MHFFDFTFWQNFGSNLLATVVGVTLGIPIAFWINRRIENTAEKQKRYKILELLWHELSRNQDILDKWQTAGEDNWDLVKVGIQLGVEVWDTFSDGGELQWINDPYLLIPLSNTYSQIKRIQYLTDKLINFNTMPASTVQVIRDELTKTIDFAASNIEQVIRTIQDTLVPI